jgi:glycosyltransferase involved in cell wall biosynthesis
VSARVAVVSDADAFGGAEVYLTTLLEALRARREFVAFVGDRAPEETGRRLRDAGAEVHAVPGLRRIPALASIRRLASALRQVPDAIVHVNLSDQGDGIGPLLAARRSGRPIVATLNLFLPDRTAWRELVSRRLLQVVDVLIAPSREVERHAAAWGLPTELIHYAVTEPAFVELPRVALGLPDEAFVVGGIGRLHEQKGWDTLCKAAPLVRESIPSAVFTVIGDGPERESLDRLADAADVRLIGYRESAASFLQAFDVLVVPSRYESFGLVATEAMLAGVPVIASRIGGLVEAVGDAGILVEPDDPAALADAIVGLARGNGNVDTTAAAARARALFGVERLAVETEAVYERVAA